MHLLLDLAAHPVIGHRGASGSAPENTRAALELAVAQGAEAVEFDLQISADGVPLLLHDPTLDRTTSRGGPVRNLTVKQLQQVDAGYRFSNDGGRSFPWRERGVRIPTLSEVLEAFPDLPMLIELKAVDVALHARRVLLQHRAQKRVVLASFLDSALVPFREAGFPTAASRRGILALWLRARLGLPAPACPDQSYAVPERYRGRVTVPTAGFVRKARRAGRPVHVWTVDDPARAAALWSLGVSGIISNFPERILAERNRLFRGPAGSPRAPDP